MTAKLTLSVSEKDLVCKGIFFRENAQRGNIGFIDNDANRARVVAFIEHQVYTDYTAIGMNDPMTLRMMEDENMKAFKNLIRANNTRLLQQVIDTYCEIGMCNYSTIWMMYEEQSKASGSSLKW